MKWMRIPLGPLQTNCYLLINSEKECIVFDPGEEGGKLLSIIQKQKLIPKAILLTHAHFDHIGAVDVLRNEYHIPVYLHKREAEWLKDSSLNGSQSFMMAQPISIEPPDELINNEGTMIIGSFSFELLETPGHSPGSVSFYVKEIDVVFSGDALFQGSIGRTDLLGGNQEQLLSSIHKKLLVLPEDTMVLSGHGPETTIQSEMDTNPFLNGY